MIRKYHKAACLFGLICLTVALFSACNVSSDKPNVKDDFSKSEIESWEAGNTEYKYTMHGGYYLHFKGKDYPVIFENGAIVKFDNAPDELFFIKMYEMYTDPNLKNRCCYLGLYEEFQFFAQDIQHHGYLLDGKRPKNGTVLYIDETKEKQFSINYGNTQNKYKFGPDDELFLEKYNGERAREVCANSNNLIYSGSDGVFYEDRNTIRKLFEFAKNNGVPFDGKLEYTCLSYPTSILRAWDNRWWQDEDSEIDADFLVSTKGNSLVYNITLKNLNDGGEMHCKVFDAKNKVPDQNDTEMSVFNSTDEFNDFLDNFSLIDRGTKKAVSYFSCTENGERFNGRFYYLSMSLYAVWEDAKVVTLNSIDDSTEIYVCTGSDIELPTDVIQPGYEFVGWYTNEIYSGQPITTVTYANDYTDLYAKFKKVDFYTISLEPFGDRTFEDIKYAYGEEVQLPMLSKSFHLFKGWCADKECATEPFRIITSDFFGSYHLYPCFEPLEYIITVVSKDTLSKATVRYGEEFTLPIAESDVGFIGYFDIDGIQYTDKDGKSLSPFTDGADIQLFARFKEE